MHNFTKQDSKQFFGEFGGAFVPEMLVPALQELEKHFETVKLDKAFRNRLNFFLESYVGRPARLYEAHNTERILREEYGAKDDIRVYLKLESHNHTGAHKINNVMGQILMAETMGKSHIIAETGAGQHGLATAAACAKFNKKCTIFMGEVDMKRQYPNVFAMRQMGANVVAVKEGTATLKDAVNAALKYWVENVDDTYYLIGSALGPHPYPSIVEYFQSIIGIETKEQIWDVETDLPSMIIACVGGGSNALGMFGAFLDEKKVQLIGVEAGGKGVDSGRHASRFANKDAKVGIAQGYKSYFLQDEEGQLSDTYSISAGLDYAGISPQMADLYEKGRVRFVPASDETALKGYKLLARAEGMIPALESAHALGVLTEIVSEVDESGIVVVNVSGRGDKDLFIVAPEIERDEWLSFLQYEIDLHSKKQ